MFLQVASKTQNDLEERFKKYDVHEHVMLFHSFNLILASYKHSKKLPKDDLEVLLKMINMGEKSPILTWLACDLIWKKVSLDSLLIKKDCEEKSIELINLGNDER